MAKNKKNKVVEMLSPENYIKQKARSLPIHKCTINADWEQTGLAQIAVLRKHVNDHYTIGFYLVDLLCLGVKDAFYLFNVPQQEFEESYARQMYQMPLKTIPYNLAHNIIYAGLEFADEYGFKPHKAFNSVAKYILEEDTDAIEIIDVECGHKDDGKPVFFRGPDDDEAFVNKVIKQLDKSAGQGNYHFANLGYDDLIDELEVPEEGETFDLSFLDDIDFWLNDIIEDELNKLDETKKTDSTTFQFKIQIKNISKPTVWRKISVPSYYSFALLHHIIQAVFDWEDAHLYQFSEDGFEAKTIIVDMIDEEYDNVNEQLQASEIALSDIFKEKGQKFIYIYDFGDNWEHEIILEKIIPEQSEIPKLLDGQGACPPEDCGGAWGYENLKTILANPKHKEYQDYMEWMSLDEGQTWDPNEFDLEDTQLFLEEMFDRE